jgi:hypothetical protein
MIEQLDWVDDVLMGGGLLFALLTGDYLIGGIIFVLGAVLHAIFHGMI